MAMNIRRIDGQAVPSKPVEPGKAEEPPKPAPPPAWAHDPDAPKPKPKETPTRPKTAVTSRVTPSSKVPPPGGTRVEVGHQVAMTGDVPAAADSRPVTRSAPAWTKALAAKNEEPAAPLSPADQAVVDQATAVITSQTIHEDGANTTFHPQAGAVALQAQIDAHPELADEILAANSANVDVIGASVYQEPPDRKATQDVVDILTDVSATAGDEGRDVLAASLEPPPGASTDPLVVALANSPNAAGTDALIDAVTGQLNQSSSNRGRTFHEQAGAVRAAVQHIGQASVSDDGTGEFRPNPAGTVDALNAELAAHPEYGALIVNASEPTLDASLDALTTASPDVIAQVVQSYATAARAAGPQGSDALAVDLIEHLGAGLPGVLRGLTEAGLNGTTQLAESLRDELYARQNPAAQGLQEVLNVAGYLDALEAGLPADGMDALEALTAASDSARALRVLSESNPPVPPEVMAGLLARFQSDGSLDKLLGVLGSVSGIDGLVDQGRGSLENQVSLVVMDDLPDDWKGFTSLFDRAIGDLSRVLSTVDDPQVTDAYATDLVEAIPEGDIGAFDEAFYTAVGSGKGATLAAAVIVKLNQSGRTGQANNLVGNVADGLGVLQEQYQEAANAADAVYGDLAVLDAQFGPFAEPGELDAANAAFLDDHGDELRRNEFLSGAVAGDVAVVEWLQQQVPDLGNVDKLEKPQEKLLEDLPRWGSTPSGAAKVARVLAEAHAGRSTYLDKLAGLDVDDPEAWRAQVGDTLVEAGLQAASEAVESGNPQGLEAFRGLADVPGGFLGNDPETLRVFTESTAEGLEELLGEREKPLQTPVQLDLFAKGTEALEKLLGEGVSKETLSHLGVGAAVLGGAAWFLGGDERQTLPDELQGFANLAYSGSVAAKALAESPDFLARFTNVAKSAATAAAEGAGEATASRIPAYLEGLGKTASIFGFVSASVDAVQGLDNLFKGDVAGGLKELGLAAGGYLALGGPVGIGAGIVVIVGTELAYAQYQKVKASNHFEGRDDVIHFLQQLVPEGTPSDNLSWLRNADSDGVLSGIVFQGAAQAANIPLPELFDRIALLEPDQLGELVEVAHGMIDKDHTTLTSLAPHDGSEGYVGQVVRWYDDGANQGVILLDKDGKESQLYLRESDGTYSLRDDEDWNVRIQPPKTLPALNLDAEFRNGAQPPELETGGKFGGSTYAQIYPSSTEGFLIYANQVLPGLFDPTRPYP